MPTHMKWTVAALDCARQHGVDAAAQALVLPADVQVDDHVELQGRKGPVTFIVRRRCWLSTPDGQALLRVEIDYPARPSGLG